MVVSPLVPVLKPENIPAELQSLSQWVLWRREKRDEKLTKVLYNARTLRLAKSTDASTWSTFADALDGLKAAGDMDGIGFVFSPTDPYFGLDIDHCVRPDGSLTEEAAAILVNLRTYTEWSQSRTGLHLIGRGKLPPGRRKHPERGVEMYEESRFFTVTGDIWGGRKTIQDLGKEITRLHTELFPAALAGVSPTPFESSRRESSGQPPPIREAIDLTDAELIEKAAAASPSFRALWHGDISAYASASEADMALACHVVWWTNHDLPRALRIVESSPLSREKWQTRRGPITWIEDTVTKADQTVQDGYRPESNGSRPAAAARRRRSPDDETEDGGREDLSEEAVTAVHETDMGNGARFAALNAGKAHYSLAHGWLVYDGMRWKPDPLAAQELAKDTIRSIYREAAEAPDKAARRRLAQWALKSEENRRIQSMLTQGRSEAPIVIEGSRLDQEPWLFNCANGTLDLQTGELKPHDPDHLLTLMTPLSYNPLARCPQFEKAILEIMDNRPALVDYLQTWLGHCLTGSLAQQEILFLSGEGANGKNTLMEVVARAMGEYADAAPKHFLMEKRNEPHSQEIVSLVGKRLLVSDEADKDQRLNESLVKQLTGGFRLRGHLMHQNDVSFMPQFRVVLMANHRPIVRGTDHAIWRRLPMVPFDRRWFNEDEVGEPKKDLFLLDRLFTELEGVLAWLVVGARRWISQGRQAGRPDIVRQASAAYRADMDILADFLMERCETGPDYSDTARTLYTAYQAWSGRGPTMSAMAFAAALRDRGFAKKHTEIGARYLGIRVREELPPDPYGEK